MKNGYYITATRSGRELGVDEKIAVHLKLFGKYYNMARLEIPENKIQRKYLFKLPFFGSGRKYNETFNAMEDPGFIYIRKVPFEKTFLSFLRKIKDTYPKCKLLIELPTYPYDEDEYDKWFMYFLKKKDIKYRNQLAGVIDAIVTYSKEPNIFGCYTLNVANGVDCDAIEPVTDYSLKNNEIRLIAVARLRKHHGLERIIRGMADYYKNPHDIKIEFDILGDGPEMEYYKKLIDENGMNQYIHMYGPIPPDQLSDYYNKADIAISSLGFYKIGLYYSTNLKNRDYMVRGLPIVCCCDDDAFVNNPYVCIVPNDETDIDMQSIIDFYDKCYVNGKEKVIKTVRQRAYENVDISSTYKLVTDFIEEQ